MAVSDRIQQMQHIFQEIKQSPESQDIDSLLSGSFGEFTSVAYEAAASKFAVIDIKNCNFSFPLWSSFLEKYGTLHSSQIHVGLGWALCETQSFNTSFLDTLDSIWRWRVLDGYGYYSGLFLRRESIRKQTTPSFITGDDFHAFNQGLGRSLWYLSQGEPDRLVRALNLFDAARKEDLWRGVGLAATYVGSVENKQLDELKKEAESFFVQFKCGALLAIAGRQKAEQPTENSSQIAKYLSLENPELVKMVSSKSSSFRTLLQGIEGQL